MFVLLLNRLCIREYREAKPNVAGVKCGNRFPDGVAPSSAASPHLDVDNGRRMCGSDGNPRKIRNYMNSLYALLFLFWKPLVVYRSAARRPINSNWSVIKMIPPVSSTISPRRGRPPYSAPARREIERSLKTFGNHFGYPVPQTLCTIQDYGLECLLNSLVTDAAKHEGIAFYVLVFRV